MMKLVVPFTLFALSSFAGDTHVQLDHLPDEGQQLQAWHFEVDATSHRVRAVFSLFLPARGPDDDRLEFSRTVDGLTFDSRSGQVRYFSNGVTTVCGVLQGRRVVAQAACHFELVTRVRLVDDGFRVVEQPVRDLEFVVEAPTVKS